MGSEYVVSHIHAQISNSAKEGLNPYQNLGGNVDPRLVLKSKGFEEIFGWI